MIKCVVIACTSDSGHVRTPGLERSRAASHQAAWCDHRSSPAAADAGPGAVAGTGLHWRAARRVRDLGLMSRTTGAAYRRWPSRVPLVVEAQLVGCAACGEVEAGGDGLDCAVQAFEECLAASLPAAVDPVTARQAQGGHGEFGQDVQPQVFGVQVELTLLGAAQSASSVTPSWPWPRSADAWEQLCWSEPWTRRPTRIGQRAVI
jgi:hypothetical protein